MSETPRTDSAFTSICHRMDSLGKYDEDHVPADFARQLERELNAANIDHKQELTFYRTSLGRIAELFGHSQISLIAASDKDKPQETYADVLVRLIQGEITERDQLRQQLAEANKSYQTVKGWVHRLESKLATVMEECDAYADGAPDAGPLEKFANEMISRLNEGTLVNITATTQERDSLHKQLLALQSNHRTLLRMLRESKQNFDAHGRQLDEIIRQFGEEA